MAASVTKYWKGGGILKFQKLYEKLFEITASQHIYLFRSNNGNNRTMCEVCSKLAIATPERRQ